MGPIDPPDPHKHCIACLGLAHTEAAFSESDCVHCTDLPAHVSRTLRNIACGLTGMRSTAARKVLVDPPLPCGDNDDFAWGLRPLTSPHSPVLFFDESLRPPSAFADVISFGLDEDKDSMSISASEKYWADSERDCSDSEGPPDFHVGGAEVHGYVRMPPVEETVATHLCPSLAMLGADLSLLSKHCRLTTHLSDKAYTSAGEAASVLHKIAVLQVFQVKLLQSLDSGIINGDAVKDLLVATDFALMAAKRSALAIGRSMGFMVVLHWHQWLILVDLKNSDRKTLLNAPITPSSLFGDTVESSAEHFSEAQMCWKVMIT